MAVRSSLAFLCLLLGAPAGASAAMTFGAPAGLMPDGSPSRSGSTAFLTAPGAPADGVLVRWTLPTESTPNMVPAVFRAGAVVSPDLTPSPAADRPVRLPVRMGDQLGLRAPDGTLPQAFDGQTLLVTGVIEPDADHDEYGDESQDVCPAEASLHVAPCTADVALTMTGPAFGVVDRDTPYDVTVANRGPSAAAGVTVTDVVPAGARLVRTAGAGTCTPGPTVRCTLPPIAANASATVTIVRAGTSEGASFRHAVSVATSSTDPTLGDHGAAVDTLVTGASVAPAPLTLAGPPCANPAYLPRGGKAAVVLTGDDHGNGGTAGQFDTYEADSPNGCSVADWQCVRSTSYVFESGKLTDAQAQAYQRAGFEIALHLRVSGPNKGTQGCNDFTSSAGLTDDLVAQREAFADRWPSLAASVTGRTHCIVWSDWAGTPKAEREAGIRLDTSYYYWPAAWVQNRPGMFTGSGFPMRFADTDGSLIDVYQAATQLSDESGIDVDRHISALLDGALGPDGYYGVFTANMHTDKPDNPGADAIVAEAEARGVPVVSARQMLTWLDGRNGSSFRRLSFTRGRLRFAVAPAAGARGLEAMVPARGATGVLTGLTRDGAPVDVTRRTVKGIDYAMFAAAAGDYVATYPRRP